MTSAEETRNTKLSNASGLALEVVAAAYAGEPISQQDRVRLWRIAPTLAYPPPPVPPSAPTPKAESTFTAQQQRDIARISKRAGVPMATVERAYLGSPTAADDQVKIGRAATELKLLDARWRFDQVSGKSGTNHVAVVG